MNTDAFFYGLPVTNFSHSCVPFGNKPNNLSANSIANILDNYKPFHKIHCQAFHSRNLTGSIRFISLDQSEFDKRTWVLFTVVIIRSPSSLTKLEQYAVNAQGSSTCSITSLEITISNLLSISCKSSIKRSFMISFLNFHTWEVIPEMIHRISQGSMDQSQTILRPRFLIRSVHPWKEQLVYYDML